MYGSLEQPPRVLIVESNIAQRRNLVDAILHTNLTREIQEAHSVAEAQELLSKSKYEICFVGSGLSETTQRNFISAMTKSGRAADCVFIPLCKNPDRNKVLEFVQAGAHGVLVTPLQPPALRRVIETAFAAKDRNISEKLTIQDQVGELATQLEELAVRLGTAVDKIKADSGLLSGAPITTRALKDVVSTIFADCGENKLELTDLLFLILKEMK